MTLKQSVKKLRNDKLFQKIYNKWKKRRSRYEDKISLEDARKEALLEYYSLREMIKSVKPNLNPDDYDNFVNNELVLISKRREEETIQKDFYVVVAGKSMLNSRWQRLKQIQSEKGTSPTITPDKQLQLYLLSLFKDNK